ncbi:spore germination protein [Mahella sp.]|uniref:spore germination protein n=1 Tax=Mahella sp. TaxID=2798721 RepID=UPI0025C2C72B|nr:spore germination protein [Mahella sp.]MBZ4664759.1 GerA spore germination protein [Mahella sp.]
MPIKVIKRKKNKSDKANTQTSSAMIAPSATSLYNKLEDNISLFATLFSDCSDVIFRRFQIGKDNPLPAAIIYVDGLANRQSVDLEIMEPLMYFTRIDQKNAMSNIDIEIIKQLNITVGEIKEDQNVMNIVNAILSGDTAMFIDNFPVALILNSRGWENRGVQEPTTENVIRGPKEGFTETVRFNTALIRRRIKDPKLKMKGFKLGKRTKTDVVIAYMDDIVNETLLQEIEKRLNTIDTDAVFESGYIEQFIEDSPFSPFPQMQTTERPDKVAGNLLEGRVAILVDGTPVALIAPATFAQLYQSPEDYYERAIFGTAVRLIRLMGLFLATSLPSFYVAVLTYHHEMIPTQLVLALARSRMGVPFPAILEALLMEGVIEILREATTRLPGTIGQTIGIIGTLVIGQAAVAAKLVSPAMIIIVSITAIGAYITPNYSTTYSIRFIRFPLMIAAAFFGVFGIAAMWLFIIIHLAGLESFGIPYLAPVAPFKLSDIKDTIVRFPLWAMKKRPMIPENRNLIRQGSSAVASSRRRTRW